MGDFCRLVIGYSDVAGMVSKKANGNRQLQEKQYWETKMKKLLFAMLLISPIGVLADHIGCN